MGQRVKYCTGLHFARGNRRQARGGEREGTPFAAVNFTRKRRRGEDLSAICFPQIGAILACSLLNIP